MRNFWKIIGKKHLYTAKAYAYITDKKTGERFYVDLAHPLFLKKKDYPKQRADLMFSKYDFCYNVPAQQQPVRIETIPFKGTFKVYDTSPWCLELEFLDLFGAWQLKGSNPALYTTRAVDFIRDKRTGKMYTLGERKLFFREDETPFPLVEFSNDYEFYTPANDCVWTMEDTLREMNAALFLGGFSRK